MEEAEEPRPHRRVPWIIVAGLLVAVLVLYPLSIGPAYVFAMRSTEFRDFHNEFYQPLCLILEKTGTDELALSYCEWCYQVADPR